MRGAERVSLALDADLHAPRAAGRRSAGRRAALALVHDQVELAGRLGEEPRGRRLVGEIDHFLRRYGHRSHSLDLYQPPFAAAPEQVYALLLTLGETGGMDADAGTGPAGAARRAGLGRGRGAAAGVALPRRCARSSASSGRACWRCSACALVRLGRLLAQQGALAAADDLFFLTADEVERARRGRSGNGLAGRLAAERRREWRALVAAEAAGAVVPPSCAATCRWPRPSRVRRPCCAARRLAPVRRTASCEWCATRRAGQRGRRRGAGGDRGGPGLDAGVRQDGRPGDRVGWPVCRTRPSWPASTACRRCWRYPGRPAACARARWCAWTGRWARSRVWAPLLRTETRRRKDRECKETLKRSWRY